MQSYTLGVTIPAPAQKLFEFLIRPENLPRWAVNLASAVRHRDGQCYLVSNAGERELSIRADAATGVVDYGLGANEKTVVVPSRVVPNGDGCEYLFTVFLRPGLAPEEVERRLGGVRQELEVLRSLFS